MNVSAGPLYLVVVVGAAVSLGLSIRSIFSYQRSVFRYRVWAIRDDLFDMVDRGELTRSPQVVDLLRVAESSLNAAELITPYRVWVLLNAQRGPRPPKAVAEKTPRRETHMVSLYNRRMTVAWVRLLLFGSPSGWLVLVGAGSWGIISAPFRGATHLRSFVRDLIARRFVDPTKIADLDAEAVYSGRREPIVA